MVLSWSLQEGTRTSSQAKYDFRLDEQDWEKVCWGWLPKGEARSLHHQLSRRAKWAAVLRRATRPEGGSWRHDFGPEDMTPHRLQALARVIDAEFFQGTFHHTVARKVNRHVSYTPADVSEINKVAKHHSAAVTAPPIRQRRCGLAPLTVVRPSPLALPPPSGVQGLGDEDDGGGDGAAATALEPRGGGYGMWGWLRGLRWRGRRDSGGSCGRGGRDGGRALVGGGGAGHGVGRGGAGGGSSPVTDYVGASASYQHTHGRIIFWRQAWGALSPSPGHPVRVDGVACTSRLSWLAHTLGHEMLHALIFSMCGAYARDAPSNVALKGHGYNFLMLNWYVLGHRGYLYDDRGWRLPRPMPYRL